MDRANQRTNHLLGRNIRRLRLEEGLRNKDIVTGSQTRNMDVTIGIYSKIEVGLNNPNVDLLIVLIDTFGCDFNTFLANKEES